MKHFRWGREHLEDAGQHQASHAAPDGGPVGGGSVYAVAPPRELTLLKNWRINQKPMFTYFFGRVSRLFYHNERGKLAILHDLIPVDPD